MSSSLLFTIRVPSNFILLLVLPDPLFLLQWSLTDCDTSQVAAHGLDYSSPVLSHTTRESAV
uniref:Uncharacterized protein n=1 Tax=Physcomitrium patens TaxID=3218 RepID=A0A7I3ZLZ1_PHYPA